MHFFLTLFLGNYLIEIIILELNRKLNVSNSSENEEKLEKQLENEEQKNAELLEELERSQKKTAALEKTLEHTVTIYKDKITQHVSQAGSEKNFKVS